MTDSTDHLRGLNSEQRRAVLHTEGPLLVLAGAGSGKTKTLVHRIVQLIRGRDVDPGRIAVVTFTNKAADEMRERVRDFAGKEARRVTISTFHSLGVRILRDHGERIGLPARFAIYDTGDQLAALRTACAEISIDDDAFDLKRILRRISDWKTRRIAPPEAVREVQAVAASGTRADDYAVLSATAYARYEEVLRAAGAVDFDDLLLLPVRLLKEHEDARTALWKRWHYLMVDEYQDTNAVQLELARLLAGTRRNLCVVGDDDQSIYAFRGADVGNILEFERHFPGARVITLEQNYRSTRRILEAANAVIAGNPHRHAKRLRTENQIGAPIDYYEHGGEEAEAEVVAQEVSVRRFMRKREWRDFAILYRTNTQARPLEEALRGRNVPYRVVGGTSFFERKEVADALAYLRAVANPLDEIALRRIINYPTRGIGRTTVLRMAELARERGVPFGRMLDAAADAGVGAAQAAAIQAFLGLLAEQRALLADAEAAALHPPRGADLPPLAAFADALFRRAGLDDAIRADPRNARSAGARADNLRDLVGTINRYERRVWAEAPGLDASPADDAEPWSPPSLAEALSRIALASPDDEDDQTGDQVTLMTLHSAKGLEFDEVFLVGLEEEILPHARSIADAGAGLAGDPLAEERRLLYVGITRARHHLTLSLCRARSRNGEPLPRLPSRYLAEIPRELLNMKAGGAVLSPDESADLKKDFFKRMKEMLNEGGAA
jgi:superfamily I DNA/RNA helicase